MDWSEHPLLYKIVISLPILAIVNILVLDIFFTLNVLNSKKEKQVVTTIVSSSVTTPTPLPTQASMCSNACIDIIRTATSSAKTVETPVYIPARQASKVKDYFIPLGTASFYSAGDWGDVTGIRTYVNTDSFENIKNVDFEVSLHVPNANEDVWIRLYNVTDSYAVPSSELYFASGTKITSLNTSIKLTPGNKLYQVQMKTQFKTPASLNQSRIHITTE